MIMWHHAREKKLVCAIRVFFFFQGEEDEILIKSLERVDHESQISWKRSR